MRKAATKALYLFLCAILGMVLFAMLHRAIFVLYDLLIFIDNIYTLGISQNTIAYIDFFSLLVVLFLGGWYGTMMGIDWYAMVYGPNAEVRPGLFHGFIPHHWRGQKAKKTVHSKMSATAPSTPMAHATTVKVSSKKVSREPEPEEVIKPPVREWTFDDLITPKPVVKKKTTVKKTATKKVVRKSAAKKVAKVDKTE